MVVVNQLLAHWNSTNVMNWLLAFKMTIGILVQCKRFLNQL